MPDTDIETLLRMMWPQATEHAIREAASDPTSYEHQRAVRVVAYIRTQTEAARVEMRSIRC
jgi:hypothetical protein